MTLVHPLGDPPPLYPQRTPEPEGEAMTPSESAALAAWQSSPTGRAVYAALAQHIVVLAGEESCSPTSVLSVGEGHGRLADEVAQRLPNTPVVGTDLCSHVVAAASEAFTRDNLRFAQASVYELQDVESADLVICAMSLHHFSDPRRALRGLWSRVRPGGLLYVVDLRRDPLTFAYRRRLTSYQGEAPVVARLFEQSVAAAYTSDELRALVQPLAAEAALARMGPVQLGLSSKRSFLAKQPHAVPSWPEVVTDVGGLWIEFAFTRIA